MTIAVRGTSVNNNGAGSAVTLDLSNAAAVAGDFGILLATANANLETWSLDQSGWTAYGEQYITNTVSANVWWKVLTSTDITNNTITATKTSVNTGATRCAGGLIVFSGVDHAVPLDPVAVNPTLTSQSVSDSSMPFAAIDPTNHAFMVVVQAINGGTALTGSAATAGWTEQYDTVTATASREASAYCQTYDSNMTSASVAAGDTTPNATSFGFGWTFALAPRLIPHLHMAPSRW